MQISELFVSLGVKGSEKTVEAFTKVKSGISGIASTSIEAKAAILGATYALEQLMSSSAQRGTDLKNLSDYLGISTKQLQQWQYAARQAGVSNEEFTGSLKSVYDKLAQMRLGGARPPWFALFSQTVGGFDLEKSYKDPLYALQKIQEFARSNVSTIVQNPILKGWGLSDNMIAATREGTFNQGNLQHAPLYSDREIKNLKDVGVMWDNLENKVAMFFGHFTAANGKSIVKDLSDLTDKVLKLASAFEVLLSKLRVFKILGDATSGWNTIFDALNGKHEDNADQKILDKVYSKMEEGSVTAVKAVEKPSNSIFDGIRESLLNSKKYLNPGLGQSTNFQDVLSNLFNFLPNSQSGIISPPSPLLRQNSNPNQTQNTSINQNLYFQHEGKEYGQIKDSVNESVAYAWRQLSSQSQAT